MSDDAESQGPPVLPTRTIHIPFQPRRRGMFTEQQMSPKVGELIEDAFYSLLRANEGLEKVQELVGLGMDLSQLLAPHSHTTWKILAPQERRFRENWDRFISAMGRANSNADPNLQRTEVEGTTVDPAPTPSPALTVRGPQKVTPVMQVQVW